VRISIQIAMMAAWPSVIATSPADPEVRARATPLAEPTPHPDAPVATDRPGRNAWAGSAKATNSSSSP
jgi:hypothetical protein